MPRKPTLYQNEFPYHASARSINADWFNLPMDRVWSIMSEQLYFVHHAFGAEILSFVLMSNHFHLMLRTTDAPLNTVMEWFLKETSRSLTREGNRINQTYGGRYFRSLIKSHHYFLNAYKYIYANPVKAGICASALQYPYSTLRGSLGLDHMIIPQKEDLTLLTDVDGTIRWIDAKTRDEDWDAVGNALRRKEFKFNKINKKEHYLERSLL